MLKFKLGCHKLDSERFHAAGDPPATLTPVHLHRARTDLPGGSAGPEHPCFDLLPELRTTSPPAIDVNPSALSHRLFPSLGEQHPTPFYLLR